MRPHALCFASVLAALALGYADSAFACGALPCGWVNDVMPENGAEGVPLNTELRVLYFGHLAAYTPDIGCELDVTRMRLVPHVGETLELSGAMRGLPSGAESWLVAKPAEPLAAGTVYALQVMLSGGDACGCEERQWSTVTTFSTGASEDHEAPRFAGISSVEYGERSRASTDCGEIDAVPVLPQYEDAQDANGGVRYNVYVNGQLQNDFVPDLRGDRAGAIVVDCGNTALQTRVPLSDGALVEARAVDLAGNESVATPAFTVSAVCEAADATADEAFYVADAEPATEAAEASDGDSNPPVASREAPGCAVASGAASTSGAPAAALSALLGLVVARRLRRRSSPR